MADVPGISHRLDADGIVRVVFDLPDEKVNLLNEQRGNRLGHGRFPRR
jgi:hypothetical protein